jgi:acetyl esterase
MSSHDGADPEVRRLIALLVDRGPEAPPAALREAFVDFVRKVEAMGPPHAEVAEVRDTAIPGDGGAIPVRLYLPAEAAGDPGDCFVFLHGGGWTVGDLETGDLGARALCEGLGIRVVSVHYRLAPEHPFPAPLDDCMAVLRALRGRFAGSLYVGGESAGANLSAAAALLCRDEAIRLAGQVLINPAVDHRTTSASHRRLGHGEGLTTEAVETFFGWYVGDADPADPRISPIFAETLVGVAPCFLVTAEFDPLLDDGAAYAKRLIDAGVPLTYLRMPGMMHAWWALTTASAAADANLKRMLALARGFVAAHR